MTIITTTKISFTSKTTPDDSSKTGVNLFFSLYVAYIPVSIRIISLHSKI